MGLHLADWLHRRLLSGVSHPNPHMADCAVFVVHDPVSDLEHHSNDILDTIPWPQWDRQLYAYFDGRY